MFIILITYTKSLEIIDQHLAAHRAYLDEGYKNNYLITSGPQEPRTGGVLISQLVDKAELELFLKHDPFYLHNLSRYDIIEFSPVKYHPDFEKFI